MDYARRRDRCRRRGAPAPSTASRSPSPALRAGEDKITAADKTQARALARLRRRELHAQFAEAAPAAARFAGVFAPARVVAVYLAQGFEFDPAPLARALRVRGAVIALPVVVAKDAPLEFRLWSGEAADLAPDAVGFAAPAARFARVKPELVFVPLLAFDGRGARLGQGGGYYDRTLPGLRTRGAVRAVGLAYAGQEVDSLPVDAYDAPLDGVLTEAGLRLFTPAPSGS